MLLGEDNSNDGLTSFLRVRVQLVFEHVGVFCDEEHDDPVVDDDIVEDAADDDVVVVLTGRFGERNDLIISLLLCLLFLFEDGDFGNGLVTDVFVVLKMAMAFVTNCRKNSSKVKTKIL